LIDSFIRREEGIKVRKIKAFICAIFNLPFAHRSWIAYDANFIPRDERLGLERTIALGMEPRIADGITGLYIIGGTRAKIILQFCATVAIVIIFIVAFLMGYIKRLI